MDEMQPRSATPLQTGKKKFVYTIVERKDKEKKYWVRIGNAHVNSDLSLNVWLDATPTNGMLHIRDADFSGYGGRRGRPEEDADGGGVA